jgi:hypothetical protein
MSVYVMAEGNAFLQAHPPGSLYFTSRPDEDTAEKVTEKHGGTWSKLAAGTFPRAAGTTAGGTGGEEKHKLTTAEIGYATHQVEKATSVGEWTGTTNTQGIVAHNNIPPYKDFHIYERMT